MPFPPSFARRLAPGRRVRLVQALARRGQPLHAEQPTQNLCTLSIDIGGTGIKMLVLNARGRPINPRARVLTPQPATPKAVLEVIRQMLGKQPAFQRIAVGFPGVVSHGVVHTAANLDSASWENFQIEKAITELSGSPVRVINDADLQGYGVVKGRGVELVLTLGTGLGSALFINGHLVPNLELGHHPFKKDMTYEERVSDAEFKRLGKKHWSERVKEMLDQLQPIFNPDIIHLGGGNAEHIRTDLPLNVRHFSNVDGMTGGVRIWMDDARRSAD